MIKSNYLDYTEEEILFLDSMSLEQLEQLYEECHTDITLADTNQQNRKILLNSLYGALGNIHFRFYDLRNALAITSFGRVAIQWGARKTDEFMNRVCQTENQEYVFYVDTDSNYTDMTTLIEKRIGLDRFHTTDDIVNFLDKFASTKLEPQLKNAFDELCEYMNHYENRMNMDREAIACPPLGSNGVGGFWNAKKRYALNVWDMEGTRYKDAKLKIMGIETQRSSTPKAVQNALKESIRIVLQEGEKPLQDYFKQFKKEYKSIPYRRIAKVSTANNIAKYSDANGYPAFKCPSHIKGVLAYHRAIEGTEAPKIQEGEKVMVLPLRRGNPFREDCIAWSSGTEIPIEVREKVLKYLDYDALFDKTFVTPLATICENSGVKYEHRVTLDDMFDF